MMNTHLKKIGGLFAAFLLAASVQASLLLQENFTYTNGNATAVSGGNWTAFSSAGVLPVQVFGATATFTNLSSGSSGEDLRRDIPGGPYNSGFLYMSSLVAIYNAPTATNGDYFLSLYSTNTSGGGYSARIFSSAATSGWNYGLSVGGIAPTDWSAPLSTATWYKIILKYDVTAKTASFGVFTPSYAPTNDSELSVSFPTAGGAQTNVTSVVIRQGSASGSAWKGAIDYILVGTMLADVASNAPVTPAIVTQPQDAAGSVGSGAVSFGTLAVGEAADAPLHYQWFYNTNTPLTEDPLHFSGTANSVLVVTNLSLGNSGTYSCVVSNAGGQSVTRYALLSVSLAPVPPTIDSDVSPITSTNNIGDSVGFSVAAHGVPAVAYQWKWIPDTNTLVTNIITGATSASLPLSNLSTNQSGKYFVTITNSTAYYSTNSSMAVLKVNPSPSLAIADLRAMVDGGYNPTNTTSYYTIQGTVTTWTNMTTSAAPQFFMQDSTAGIMVFWNNAGGSNCPPAGAVVKVTGPLAAYQGNLEIKPDYNSPITGTNGVQIISTGGPLPAPQPLPFDRNITGNAAAMKMLEGTYFVASNVMLTAGTTFVSANESMTNNSYHIKLNEMSGLQFTNHAGETATIYINNYVGIVGQAKPTGPVTIYGVLQNYFGLYEFVPTRYSDIVSYISTTNVMTNARKGDAPTNNYTENVLRPGETLTAYLSISDPEGGSVTLTPLTDGLPASASWTVLASGGMVGKAVFKFTPTIAESASNYLATVNVTSTSGNTFANTETVYVPSVDEQKMAISEFLANPTTNASAPHFNPLQRATDIIGTVSNDQYIEVANFSAGDLAAGWTLDNGNRTKLLFDSYAAGSGVGVSSSNSVIIYSGGPETPGIATPIYTSTVGLGLTTGTGSGLLVLRNGNNGGGGSGNIIDRVLYSGIDASPNGSLTRFPTIEGAFVPQSYVSTNHVTPGAQYNGGSWAESSSVPQAVSGVAVSVSNNRVVLNFTADTTKASTLWRADNLTGPFTVVNGGQFASPGATFTETNPPSKRFYYITTQQ